MKAADVLLQLMAPGAPVRGVRIEWLRSNNGYTPQTYRQLAKAYRADGRDREAKMVEMAQEDDLLRLGDLAGPTRFGRRLLGWIIGHGYRPGRSAWALVVLYALTLGLVWVGAQNDAFIQVGQTAPQSSVTSSHCADAYPCFSPTAFALEDITPILNLHQAENWLPKSSSFLELMLRSWLYLITIVGYIGTTYLAAGLAGFVRRPS